METQCFYKHGDRGSFGEIADRNWTRHGYGLSADSSSGLRHQQSLED